jgi:hypothetical protein
MNLTSEQVHWIFGVLLTIVPITLLLHCLGAIRARWPRFIIPITFLFIGIELVLDPFIHGAAAPAEYAQESARHLLLAAVAFTVAIIEMGRSLGRLQAKAWATALPLALVVSGLLFFFHAQHQADVPVLLLVTQHRFMGTTLIIAGVAKAADELTLKPELRAGWLLLVLVFGLQLLLYTEGQSLFDANPGTSHKDHR